jgi:Skp family chaperone for outer membrane proteins
MRKLSLIILIGLLGAGSLLAQAPATGSAAGGGGGKVAVIDLQKAITDNADGKKQQEKFMAEFAKRQKDFEDKQKALTDIQTKLQTQDKALSETAKADLSKQADRLNTDLQRLNDDAQKELGELQQQLFRPIAEKVQDVLKSYSNENGFAVVFDSSSQASSIIFYQDVADITTEIIRRVDATPTKPAAAATGAPAAPAPATPKPAAPAPATPKK